MSSESVTLVQDVTPHQDYFQTQFLLAITPGGLTNLTVDSSIIDFEGRNWMTGTGFTLTVRGYEDQNLKSHQAVPPPPTISMPGPSGGPSQGGPRLMMISNPVPARY